MTSTHGHRNYNMLRTLNSKNIINISSWIRKSNICASCQIGRIANFLFLYRIKFMIFLLLKYIVIYRALLLLLQLKNIVFMLSLLMISQDLPSCFLYNINLNF